MRIKQYVKLFLFAAFCAITTLFTNNLKAQSAPQSAISTAGTFTTFANGSITWTLGEVMTETYAPTGNFFTQGFNQPDTMYLTIINESAPQTIAVYPNPVVEDLTIDLSKLKGSYSIEIFNMQGQLIRKESITSGLRPIILSFREFSTGVYILHVINNDTHTRTSCKINKK
jgi:hypothetical protein